MEKKQNINDIFDTIKILKPLKSVKDIKDLKKENYWFIKITNTNIHTFEYVHERLVEGRFKYSIIFEDRHDHELIEDIFEQNSSFFDYFPTKKLWCYMLKSDNGNIDEKNIAFLRVQKLLTENLSIELNDRIKRYGKIEY